MNDIITLANVSQWVREKAEEIEKQEGNHTPELRVLADLQHFLAEEAIETLRKTIKIYEGKERR